MSDIDDNGIKSRKFLYAVGTSMAIFVCGIMAALWESFRPVTGEILGALIGIFVAYSGANVGAKWTIGKMSFGQKVKKEAEDEETEEEESKPPNRIKVKPPIEPDHSEED